MKTLFFALAGILLFAEITAAQSIQWEGRTLNLSNVKASLVDLKGEYETYADIDLEEWITMRIEFEGKRAALYLNNQQHPSFIVNEMKGDSKSGTIGLWVDIGTEGYFKDLKILRVN
jgi:hypothetical protein